MLHFVDILIHKAPERAFKTMEVGLDPGIKVWEFDEGNSYELVLLIKLKCMEGTIAQRKTLHIIDYLSPPMFSIQIWKRDDAHICELFVFTSAPLPCHSVTWYFAFSRWLVSVSYDS